ncbi:MAG: cytochrome c [Flavobacteriales bacterium]|nr:cytochrome c [Flavobacteriales bacterium]
MYRYSVALVAFVVLCGFAANKYLAPMPYDADTPVSSILIALGDEKPEHYIGTLDMEKVGVGKDIVMTGGEWVNGQVTNRVSEYFKCVDCHNVLPESRFANDNDPESRLAYSMEYNRPYLPGSTFYGITNRTSWFNGDHEKKYGKELIEPARHDLVNAIQLCSKECSVGRMLTKEELQAVLHYLTTLELKLKDLDLSDSELASISAPGQTEEQKAQNIRLLKSKYIRGYPATFVEAIDPKLRKKGEEGNLENGEWIYKKSCLHCHGPGKVTKKTVFGNGEGQKDFDWLVKYFKKSNGGSVYWITRHGTSSSNKTPEYMPIYSKEKLSDSQIEDLAAYILAESMK